jgi:hypothetical protein
MGWSPPVRRSLRPDVRIMPVQVDHANVCTRRSVERLRRAMAGVV